MTHPREERDPPRGSYLAGLRASIPFAPTIFVVGISFGVFAVAEGTGALAAVVMSATAFAASAQFGAVAVLGANGGVPTAVLAGMLLNARFGPMGVAVAPYLHGGPLRRFLASFAIVDTSWAVASRGGGRFDREFMIGCTIPQYPAWVGGTAVGAYAGPLLGDLESLGLDAVFATFYLSLLARELRDPRGRTVAALGAVIALALVPVAPPGTAIVAACAAALLGLRRP
jgi:4-azaleucine resistance transporter AzlC